MGRVTSLAAAMARRAGLPAVTDAFRCVQRGELPGLDCAIDYYAGYLCVWAYDTALPSAVLQAQLQPTCDALLRHFGARGGVIKRNVSNPHRKGLVAEQTVFGEPPPPQLVVREHGLQFAVTLTERQHVGLFLDQRDNRQRVRALAAGRRVANLFSYTCSFSVAAAAGGCVSVASVDVSRPSLDTGRENFTRNTLDATHAQFHKQDVRRWLAAQIKRGARYDVIICDPPTYATTRDGGVFSVAQAWEDLVRDCRAILADSGAALFCNNHQAGSRAQYQRTLAAHFRRIEDRPPPPDFPVIAGRNDHVRMFWCQA